MERVMRCIHLSRQDRGVTSGGKEESK